MAGVRKTRILIAGEFPRSLEARIFREGRLAGLLCARVSGLTAWGKMLERCRFDAVLLGLAEGARPKKKIRCPEGVKLFVVGGKLRPGGSPARWVKPDSLERLLPTIMREIHTDGQHRSASAEAEA